MDNLNSITPQYNSEFPRLKRPWYKRPVFYVFIFMSIIICYYAYQFGIAYNTISVENGSWWKGIAGILNRGSAEPKPTVDPNPMPSQEPNRLDILILGIRGEDEIAIEEGGGLLTDTIMVASIDKTTQKAATISIPRDLYLDMMAKTQNDKEIKLNGRVNEVYEKGLENGGGLSLAKQIVSRITGVYIDYAIAVDFNAYKEIVNNLGGIDIFLKKPFEEKNQWGYEFSLPAGNNHLDGEQALYFVRSRYSTSDFDRARRQQEVITIIKNKALTLGFLSNPVKITSLLSDLKDNIRTDFQIWDIGNLLSLANTLGSKTEIKNYVISIDNLLYETKTEKGEYILLPKEANFGGIKNLFKNILTVAP
ncbi:MAG: LCP family protein [Candidatus Yanofskybacteria bacterium]|nr:LCP family protein [Candidatus Yanofskybacteria bacterium]